MLLFQFILIQHHAVTGICQVTGVTQPVTGASVLQVLPAPTPCCNWNTQNGSNRCNTLYTACDWSFLAGDNSKQGKRRYRSKLSLFVILCMYPYSIQTNFFFHFCVCVCVCGGLSLVHTRQCRNFVTFVM